MKLLDRLARVARQRRMADNTIECYQRWVVEFLWFCARPGGQVMQKRVDPIGDFIQLDLERDLSGSAGEVDPTGGSASVRWRHPRELGQTKRDVANL